MGEPKNACKACGKKPEVYEVIRWSDLALWCTAKCWRDSEMARMADEENKRLFLQGGNVYYGRR